ncbi:MAG: hypothetical protein O3C61_03020 [Proteobacteria bacterium]|nr:hypothetical protein [Pseudomonadota bacterium]
MKNLISSNSVDIKELNLNQILVRGLYTPSLNKQIKSQFKISLPQNNLQINQDKNIICSKNSFDQWSIILFQQLEFEIDNAIAKINEDEKILATNYSEGQIYLEISGENKISILNKITHFDFREKHFPLSTSAQTLIGRVDCNIYNLGNRLLVTCNRSFGDHLKDQLIDAIKF